ncbi:MAG: hypothetical protein ACKVKF_01080 [Rhodobacterales bacterium]|uniref:hypothetical protein n=1 Tax=Puniceibacterium antarcticum TaxID=1206336 RepID=UPI00117A4C64|nr:hypothetical protein [Puniceibacterium antarcticum]
MPDQQERDITATSLIGVLSEGSALSEVRIIAIAGRRSHDMVLARGPWWLSGQHRCTHEAILQRRGP